MIFFNIIIQQLKILQDGKPWIDERHSICVIYLYTIELTLVFFFITFLCKYYLFLFFVQPPNLAEFPMFSVYLPIIDHHSLCELSPSSVLVDATCALFHFLAFSSMFSSKTCNIMASHLFSIITNTN